MNMFIYKIRLFISNIRLSFCRSLAEGRWYRVVLPIIIFVVFTAIYLGSVYGGFCLSEKAIKYGEDPYSPTNVFDAAFYLMFNNGGENMYEGAHLVGILITSLGIVIIAILTSIITNAFDRIGQKFLSGESSFLMNDHIVIIGTSDVIYSILKSKKDSIKRFLIMTNHDVISKRREILSFLEDKSFRKRIVFIYGDRTSQKDMERLSLAYAKEVYIIGDNEESDTIESYRDSNNMDCVTIIAENQQVKKLRKEGNKLPCHVMFEYQTTFVSFQFSEMGDSFKNDMDFLPFYFYDMWAQKVLLACEKNDNAAKSKYNYLDTLPNDKGYINKESEESVHLIIVGLTKMGMALGLQAAQVCHFPNFITDNKRRTRITFIDADADIEFNYFNGRYGDMLKCARHRYINLTNDCRETKKLWENDDSWLDVEWEFVKGRVESPNVRSYMEEACNDKTRIVTVAVCLTRSHQSIATAMSLPAIVLQNSLQILVYQRLSGTIIDKIATSTDSKTEYRYKPLRPFGMIDCGYDPEFEKEIIQRAKYISYVYDSYYKTNQDNSEIEKKERDWDVNLDHYNDVFNMYASFKNYDECWGKKKVWEKLSCRYNAALLDTRLRSIGVILGNNNTYSLGYISNRIKEEISNLQRVEHNRWNVEKLLSGYRTLTEQELQTLTAEWNIWNDSNISDEDRNNAKNNWDGYRKSLKDWPQRAHLDLCSFDMLQKREEKTILEHDVKLNLAIPYILKKEGKTV